MPGRSRPGTILSRGGPHVAARDRRHPGTYAAGLQYGVSSLIPGSGRRASRNDKVAYGDNPDNPRDPDRAEGALNRRETRNRFIPSGLANEVLTSSCG